MDDLISFYSSKVAAYRQAIDRTGKQLFYIAVARLVSFIALIALVYLFYRLRQDVYIISSILLLLVFLWLVKKSGLLNDRKMYLQNLHFVNENELNILQGAKNKFDNGQSHQTGESYYADLDIFGEASLFHLLNRTSTSHGTEALANLLKHPFTSSSTIKEYQQAIQTFAPQQHSREEVIARAIMHKDNEGNMNDLRSWLQQPAVLLNSRRIKVARYLLPLLNLLTLIISLYTGNYYWLTLTVFICWLHVGYFAKYIQQQYVLVGKKQQLLDQYASVLKVFMVVDGGQSTVLQHYKHRSSQAYVQVKKLSQLTNLLDQRLNVLVNILLNSFLLYDIQCMIALERWKVINSEHLEKWIECVATIECLTSFATFAYNHPCWCYPQLINNGLVIEAKAIAHPLIKENERISNDISIGTMNKLLLITGSNMSGKTTFLRTIGVNTLLAQCGAPVCAQAFSFTPVNIYSSIRISDSLQENTSYFMAELKRLSEIKNSIASQQPSLVLIDEILRGTNSEDKYYGSSQFVQQLVQYNCLSLFATHDLKLSELENKYPGIVENYCFESVIENDELKFDYRILKGIAQNKNASFLMKKMKII